MEAKRILESIKPEMARGQILDLVYRAIVELDLKDTGQVARLLNVAKVTVHKRAAYHDIGTLIAARARIYSPSDIEALRELIFSPSHRRPKTEHLFKNMLKLKYEGKTLKEIGKDLGVSESYVSKLLKKGGK